MLATPTPDNARPIVVVADDDHGSRLAVAGVLESLATVVAFESGNAALKHLLDHPSCAAVILDIHMGELGGFEIARLLRQRQRTKDIPIIFLTGAQDSAVEGYSTGAFDFIIKPFDPDALRGKVAALVELYAQRRRVERDRDASMKREQAARAETAAQQKYLHDFLGQVAGPVARLRGPEHLFEFANAEYIATIVHKDPTGKPLTEALSKPSVRALLPILDAVYRTGVAATASEIAVPIAAGEVEPRKRYFNFVYQPIRAVDGHIEGILLQGTNVTDLVVARQEVEALSLRLSASAEEAKQLTTLQQQLLAIVGHDLRNPLHAIVANARLLQLKPDDASVAAIAVPRIARSALRMNQLISELFDFTQARLTGGIKIARETCNVSELCKQVVDELAAVHPGRVITVEASPEISGEWDGGRLQQVISNLVANGLQYSPPDSPLVVKLEDRPSEILIRVRNEGAPIPAALLGNLFEPFKRGQLEPRSGNMGLGLYIVDQVVRAHGGTVEVSSTQANGTTFTVHLPRAT
jgi:sigma-B regulation protein RsbU (phosphoserine phosphatase)